jgi:SagB-type dehydrogenase family enzyme
MNENVTLPAPEAASGMPVEQILTRRRSVRAFDGDPLTLKQLSQLLWAAQGRSHAQGFRTAPSAGALYPLELYVLVGNVTGLAQGVYKYQADAHELLRSGGGDLRADAARAALGQSWIADSPAVIVIAAVFRRTTVKYGARGKRYVHMEAGHAAQNVYLQATALDLGTTVVGAFNDDRIHALANMTPDEAPLSLLPLGRLPA